MRNFDCWYEKVCTNNCTGSCIRFLEMDYLVSHSNIPKNRRVPIALKPSKVDHKAFEQLKEVKDNIVDFVNSGKNLYITSNTTGNGKTSWAIKLMMKYFDSIWAGNGFKTRAVFVHVPTFLLQCKDFNNTDESFEELKDAVENCDLVVWDDLASLGMSAYDYSQLLRYTDIRSANNLSSIYTGNIVDRDTLTKAVGAKLVSRIWSNDTTIIEFKGGDKR